MKFKDLKLAQIILKDKKLKKEIFFHQNNLLILQLEVCLIKVP